MPCPMKVVIAHAPFFKGRPESLRVLLEQLGHDADVTVITTRRNEHPSMWEHRVWEWVEDQNETVIQLEDDVRVEPGFVEACAVVASCAPGEAVSIHLQVPTAVPLAEAGHRWARVYWLSGPAKILPPRVAFEVLDFNASIGHRVSSRMNWDNTTAHWAWSRQKPFLACLPSLAMHDVSVPSTIGYDNHPNRIATVARGSVPGARVDDPAWWGSPEDAPLLNPHWPSFGWLERSRKARLSPEGPCASCMEQPALLTIGQTALCVLCWNSTVETVNKRLVAAQLMPASGMVG